MATGSGHSDEERSTLAGRFVRAKKNAGEKGTNVPSLTNKAYGKDTEKLGFPFYLLMIYLFMEYFRPVNPMGIPLGVSVLLFLQWLMQPKKQLTPLIKCYFLFIGIIAVMGPFAANTYSLWTSFQAMTVELLCICIPIIHFVNSFRKVEMFIYALVLLHVYIALHAIASGGFGPGGAVGDENDVALALDMIVPFTIFAFLISDTLRQKILFGAGFAVMLAGVVATNSRGGFLGLLPVLLYSFRFAPHKKLVAVLAVFLVLGAWWFTPQEYWEEMATIQSAAADTDPLQDTGALRREFWAIGWRMYLANPIFGVGLGNFRWNVPDYQSEEQYQRMGRSVAGTVSHSLYFTLLAEVGTAGSIVFAAIFWLTIRSLRLVIMESKRWEQQRSSMMMALPDEFGATLFQELARARNFAHAIGAGMIGYLVSGAFLTVHMYPHFWIFTALTAALANVTSARLKLAEEYANGSMVPGPLSLPLIH